MAALIRQDLPTQPYPKWSQEAMKAVNGIRRAYGENVDWALKNLYGEGVIFDSDNVSTQGIDGGTITHAIVKMVADTLKTITSNEKARNVVILQLYPKTACVNGISKSPTSEFNHFINASSDVITAMYIPCGGPHGFPRQFSLHIGGHVYSTWHRNSSTGTFDGAIHDDTDVPLNELLKAESAEFMATFSGNRKQKTENTLLERQLVVEREAMSVSGIKTALHSSRTPFAHTQAEFIGPYMGHDTWQRIVLCHPFLPISRMHFHPVRIVLDKPCDLLVEYVTLENGPRCEAFERKDNDFFWIEQPYYSIPESESPFIMYVRENMAMPYLPYKIMETAPSESVQSYFDKMDDCFL